MDGDALAVRTRMRVRGLVALTGMIVHAFWTRSRDNARVRMFESRDNARARMFESRDNAHARTVIFALDAKILRRL